MILEQIEIGLSHFLFQANRVNLLYYNMLDRIHAPRLDQKNDPALERSDLEPLSAGAAAISTGISTSRYESEAEAETMRLAARIAGVAEAGDVLALGGPLGAGKTVFARGFIRALTSPDEEIPSPTFTLVQVYEGPDCPIHHFDLYRIERADELYELGIEEAFAEGITLIEWPERARGFANERWLTVVFAIDDDAAEKRAISFRPGAAWRARLERLKLAASEAGDD
jgi:tRNA threonylcarbamoyladenosine biosynthesis protein TsaE